MAKLKFLNFIFVKCHGQGQIIGKVYLFENISFSFGHFGI